MLLLYSIRHVAGRYATAAGRGSHDYKVFRSCEFTVAQSIQEAEVALARVDVGSRAVNSQYS